MQRERFGSCEEALEELRRRAIQVLGEGPLKEVFALRDFEPGQQVAARFEISAPGLLIREAGMDVKGDGSLVPYTGAIRKEPIELGDGEDPYAALREALDAIS